MNSYVDVALITSFCLIDRSLEEDFLDQIPFLFVTPES